MYPAELPTIRNASPPSHLPGSTEQDVLDTRFFSPTTVFPTAFAPPGPELPRVRGYEILSLIGSGGMGIVYKARHLDLQRTVALKMLHGAAIADAEAHDRFHAEAEAVARLQHPNIIQVFEIGTVQSLPGERRPSPFISLEFMDGGSLSRFTDTPQAPQFAVRMVEKLARAAHAAHSLGVVHRDLKPANVLLNRDGEPKIADFGVAKLIDTSGPSLTLAGTTVGTPEHMAPEQAAGGEPTPAMDVYALGVILYQLLTARLPFHGSSPVDTMYLVRHQEPVSPRRLQPGLPRDLETICLKCLAKSPGRRYESAEALAEDLTCWVDGRTIRARPAGAFEQTVLWARRNPSVAVLSALVVLVGIVGISGVVWKWREAESQAAAADASAGAARLAAHDAEESANKERWERYRVSVMAASGALRLHDTTAARRALDAAPEAHRDWVWHQLRAQLDRSRAVLRGRGNSVRFTQFSPDARWAVLQGMDATYRLWDTSEQKEYGPLDIGTNPHHLTLSDDGATLAYGCDDRTVRLCDRATGHVRTVLRTGDLCHIEFSRDGARVVTTTSDGTLRVWDAKSGQERHAFRAPREATPLVLSPDESVVAARDGEGSSSARIWDLKTGRELVVLGGQEGSIHALKFSPTGDRIVTIQRFPNNAIHLWDVATGKHLAHFTGHENQVRDVQFSPDGTRLVSASMDRTVRVWDVSPTPAGRQSEALRVLRGHFAWVNHAAFSPDGSRVVSSSQDRTVRYWNARTGEQIAVLCGHTDEVLVSAFGDGGTTLVSSSGDGTLRLWDVAAAENGYAIRGHSKFVYNVAFFPDGDRIASAAWDGTARVWNPTTGREVLRLDHGADQYVSSIAVHSAGRFLATLSRREGGPEMSVRLWEANTGQLLHRWVMPSHWQDGRVTFAPKGDLLAASGVDGRVRLWDASTHAEVAVLEGGTTPIRDVAFSPDGTMLASACDDGDCTVRIWDVTTRKQLQVLRGHERGVYALAWNHTGTILASGSTDRTARLWDTTKWTTIGELPQGTDVHGVAFSPDGKLLACACADSAIRFWDVATRKEVADLHGHQSYVHSIAFSPDGTRLVSGSGDGTIRLWDTLTSRDRNR